MEIMSFGGGVQTVALTVMACNGYLGIEKPDHAIFADTKWETQSTYDYIKWFEGWMTDRGLKLHTVTKGDIRADALDKNSRFASMPLYTLDKKSGQKGMIRRQCTNEYKIQPVMKKIRELVGLKKYERWKGEQINLWLGISLDEAQRMKDSQIKWITYKYPLIDHLIARDKRTYHGLIGKDFCIQYLESQNIPIPPKSACIGCPFHSDYYWKNLKREAPEEFKNACDFDDEIRKHRVAIRGAVFIHRSCKPLSEVNFSDQPDLFGVAQCDEGYCGI